MNILYGTGTVLRGWKPHEDYSVTMVPMSEVVTGSASADTIKDLEYTTTVATVTITKNDFLVNNSPENPVVQFKSLTPDICSVDSSGITTVNGYGTCTVETVGQTGKRSFSHTVITAGAATLYSDVTIIDPTSLRYYLREQQLAALSGVQAGSTAQRVHATPYSAGFATSGSGVNTANFIRAQAKPGFDPFQLDVLDEMLVGVAGSAQWRAWITPHHYLTWSGHGSTSITGSRISIDGEIVVEYSATPWVGNICKLLPANYALYLPPSLIPNGFSASGHNSVIGIWSRLYNTYDAGADYRWVMPGEFGFDSCLPTDDPRYVYQKRSSTSLMVTSGDSGSPTWVGIREGTNSHATLVPVGITSYAGYLGGSAFADKLTQIQDAVSLLNASGAQTVQTVDLSGFTSYP